MLAFFLCMIGVLVKNEQNAWGVPVKGYPYRPLWPSLAAYDLPQLPIWGGEDIFWSVTFRYIP